MCLLLAYAPNTNFFMCLSLQNGLTALHAAAAVGSASTVSLLISKGADIEAKNKVYEGSSLLSTIFSLPILKFYERLILTFIYCGVLETANTFGSCRERFLC
jgi:ankyrin repeat protein